MVEFCQTHNLPHDVCGKVIVATKESERVLLDNIYKRGIENGMTGIRKISPKETKEIEPYVNSVESIWVPQTGIIDYVGLSETLANLIENQGHTILFNRKTTGMTVQNGSTVVHTVDEGNPDSFGKGGMWKQNWSLRAQVCTPIR